MSTKPIVLVVDDDLSCRTLAALLLQLGGYEPVAVASVERALERLDELQIDAVLTDLNMPLESGVDLLLALRARRSAVPVVVMTGSEDEVLIARTRELGARSILRKPYSADELRAAIAAVVPSQAAA
jgi:DNA-binding response OmpR family regulator